MQQKTVGSRRYVILVIRLAAAVLALWITFMRVVAPSVAASTTGAADREVLVALYQATDGANWRNNANWLSDAPLDAWHGVTTDESGRVIALALSENGLSGEIPSALGNLANLTALLLFNNQLSGEIPPALGNLANLEVLRLFGNRLSGEIPPALGNLTNLERLDLDDNRLSGEIPSALGNLTNLTWLDLFSNRLRGEIPPELGNLSNLEVLRLFNNRLSGEIPSELGNLTNLKVLRLLGNQLRGCVPADWRNVAESDLDSLGLPFCGASSATDTADKAALVALYNATDGANWKDNSNWLSDQPVGAWFGVTTNSNGRVTGIELPDNRLSGTIPSELGNLTNLEWLYLDDNRLSGEIPSELGNLTNLEWLNLAGNQLSGTIPSELSELINLRQLTLGKNELSGTIPPALGNLANLKWLYLQENELSGAIPSELSQLTNLELLGLWDNGLRGAIPPALGNLTNLSQLDLSGNRLSGTIPLELSQLTDLEILGLWDNELRGAILPALGKLTKLKALYLSENALRGCVPEVWRSVEESDLGQLGLPFCGPTTDRAALVALYQATDGVNWTRSDNWLSDAPLDTWHGVTTDESGRVIELDLSQNGLSGEIPPVLGDLSKLEWLWLDDNRLRGAIPFELGNLTNLTELYLGYNRLSGAIPSELGNLTNLTELGLWGNGLRGAIPSWLGNLTNLTLLGLDDNRLSGTIPTELGKLTNLTELYLSGNGLRGAIPSWLGNLTNLTLLGLDDNRLSGTIPAELGNLTNLTELYLSGNGLRGCLPAAWRNVEENDLGQLGLPYCGAAADRVALVALYQATDGANWENSANWLSDAPFDTWHGVTTDGAGRVIALDLSENGLSGEIPPALGNLTNLTWLDLFSNQLSGPIPSELGQLAKLKVLYLSKNALSGCVPEVWRNAEENDLDRLGLPFCSVSPATLPPAPPATPSSDDEITLNTPVEMPRAMLYAAYVWPAGTAIDEILVSFTVDNDVELGGNHGLYFIACTAFSIAGDGAYFGLQTDVSDPARGNLGKGAIFSRWYENDETAEVRLADTRVPERGWTESGDYEGNFVSVRGRYQWGTGDYALKVAAQETDNVGRWYGLWVIDGDGKETWIGSLRFSPGARIDPVCYSTVEVYGGPPLKPADLPYWKVSMNSPTGNGIPAALVDTWYPENVESLRNALITVNGARVTFEVGLAYIAHD